MLDLTVIVIVVVVVLVGVGAFYAWYASTVLWKKPVTGAESLVGAKGLVHSETIDGDGEVSIGGVVWRARLEKSVSGPLKKGDHVLVSSVEELTLLVVPSSGS